MERLNEFVTVWDIDYDPEPILESLKLAVATNSSHYRKGGDWPSGRGNAEPGEPGWNERLVQELIKKCPGTGEVKNAYIRTIPKHSRLPKHFDYQLLSWQGRYHWPLRTTPDVMFYYPDYDISFHLEVGKVYRLDTSVIHYAINPSDHDRTHLIMDKPHKHYKAKQSTHG